MITVALADGASVGAANNCVAHAPNAGTFAVDGTTRCLLESLARHGPRQLEEVDDDTRRSLQLLVHSGLIVFVERDAARPIAGGYRPSVTDLVVRRPSRITGRIFDALATPLAPLVSHIGVGIGTVLTAGWLIYWIAIAVPAAQLYAAITTSPIVLLAVIVGSCTIKLLLHEVGHFTVATSVGVRPAVGFGLYFTGPVAYVDLSPLDTRPTGIRIRADLGGVAIDGYVLTVLGVTALCLDKNILTAVAVATAAATFGSFNLTEKSDLYWVLRDRFSGRAVAECWDRPIPLMRRYRRDRSAQRFVRVLVGVYAVLLVFQMVALIRWLPNILEQVAENGPASLVGPGIVMGFFVVAAAAAHIVSRRHTNRHTRPML